MPADGAPTDGVDAMLLLWKAVTRDLATDELGPFRSSGRLAVPAAIAVYKNAYWIRQHEALRELFPRATRRLGEARFRELVRRYLRACPSMHPELERLGRRLPAFLRDQAEPDLFAVAAITAYELALIESFLAADHPAAALTDIDPTRFGSSRLRFVPSLQLVPLDPALRQVLLDDRVELADDAVAAIVSRPTYATATHTVGAAELALLSDARGGASIDELIERHAVDELSTLVAILDRWFRRRWVAAIDLAPETSPANPEMEKR